MLVLINWIFVGITLVIAFIVIYVNRVFIREAFQELKKVTWPGRELAFNSSGVTIGFIIGFSLMLALLDYVVNLVVRGLLK
jgi:preprotein translocase SecE subunit